MWKYLNFLPKPQSPRVVVTSCFIIEQHFKAYLNFLATNFCYLAVWNVQLRFCFYLFILDPFQCPEEFVPKSDYGPSFLLVPLVNYSTCTTSVITTYLPTFAYFWRHIFPSQSSPSSLYTFFFGNMWAMICSRLWFLY